MGILIDECEVGSEESGFAMEWIGLGFLKELEMQGRGIGLGF